MENDIKTIKYLLIGLITITLLSVWYITTDPDRKIRQECNAWIAKNNYTAQNLPSNYITGLYEQCMEQGGGKRMEWLQNIQQGIDRIKFKLGD